MKFSQYMELRGGNALTSKEASILKVDMKKNWKKRYKDLELTNEQVTKACVVLSDSGSRFKSKCNKIIGALTKDEIIPSAEKKQYLYLMCNVLGLYKIGISVDPEDRANQLANTSGVPVVLVAVWETSCEARTLESALHKELKVFRKRGEWFRFESYPVSYIEMYLTSTRFSTNKIYENPHAAEGMLLSGEESPVKPWSAVSHKGWFMTPLGTRTFYKGTQPPWDL